jgi:hypothetical protein
MSKVKLCKFCKQHGTYRESKFYTDSNRATVVQIVTTTSYAQDYKN